MKQLTAGAYLFAGNAAATSENAQGYTTSVGYSPVLETNLAQAFLRDGRARHGETVRMVDHLRGIEALCEVCDPVFLDPKGEKARG